MSNRLINETSPYLLQHAHNPVAWFPWGEEAIQKARAEDKPIFLSIGYAACHWCHVMEHESFEDPRTADFLNQHFVSIKVDREERPDLDAIYMAAVTALTGQGGWPLSAFLTPDLEPFYGGTYFPPVRRHGMPAFMEVLTSILQVWQKDRSEVKRVSAELSGHIKPNLYWNVTQTGALDAGLLDRATDTLIRSYDHLNGGWGQAPKFPAPMAIEYLLQQATRGSQPAQEIALHALHSMNRGGLYDRVGGGFHRYSTDNHWLVPHFEKMLYDNAQLAQVYLHAYQLTGVEDFKRTCVETLDFLRGEMRHPSGGFYSSLDADSEGEEGKFYTWSLSELQAALPDPADMALLTQAYQPDEHGNFEGKNILKQAVDAGALALALQIPEEQLAGRLDQIHRRLYQARSQRVRPATDDKILVSWNALASMAFSAAGRALQRPDYLDIARQNARFLTESMHSDGVLHRAWRAGQLRHTAYLEDYGALILALLDLYQADLDSHWFHMAQSLAAEMVEHYRDPQGGFYNTRNDQPNLLLRPKEYQDNATPSGNALACLALLRLSAFSGEGELLDMASAMLGSIGDLAIRYPTAFAFWLQAADFAIGPVQQVALVWPAGQTGESTFAQEYWSRYRPRAILAGSPVPSETAQPALLHDRPAKDGNTTAYVCAGFVCRQPTNDLDTFKELLDRPAAGA
ncbi:MAG: thioredoxin domain-containing protein [Chloroflexi bacterium]|nr:thioredoxin domain-containing protein [Chloroflexota bacterium]